jgi:hypothetical protein
MHLLGAIDSDFSAAGGVVGFTMTACLQVELRRDFGGRKPLTRLPMIRALGTTLCSAFSLGHADDPQSIECQPTIHCLNLLPFNPLAKVLVRLPRLRPPPSKGVDRVFVAEGCESLRAANRQQFYVSVSRFKEALTIYTDDKDELLEAVSKSSERPSATDLVVKKAFEFSDSATAEGHSENEKTTSNWRERLIHKYVKRYRFNGMRT